MKADSKRSSRRRLAVVGVAFVVAAAGAAVAHGRSTAGDSHPIAAAVSAALGITPQTLATDLRSGQTLTQIATANGKQVGDVEQAIRTGATTKLDAAVAAGKLSGANEQTILANLGSRVQALVAAKHPVAHVILARRLRLAIVGTAARYLQLTPQQLRASLKSGKTLAQLATDGGMTAAGLEQAIESAVTTRLGNAVSAGKLGAQREQALLSALGSRLDTVVNRSFAP